MTALAGLWAFTRMADPERECQRMLRAQQVYGPDPARVWSKADLALGRRLFRLLPEDGLDRSPVSDLSDRWTVVADIRLDNRDELCAALGIASSEAGTLADAAILARALGRWQEGAAERLVGDFAFAAWDAERERLFLARDFLGQRPLHYHRSSRCFAFATMPKGIHALESVPIAPRPEAMADFLALLPETSSETFFEGVEKVLPGHLLTVTSEGISSRKYWSPNIQPLRLKDGNAYAEALREKLDEAVRARLRGSGERLAAQLSGGLDSSAVAASAARLMAAQGGHVTAFTSVPRKGLNGTGPGGSILDEGPLAADVAAMYPNMEHILIRGEGKSPLASLDRNFFLYERPLLNLCNGVWSDAIMDAAKRRGLSVMLHGTAGNMSFSYNGMHLLTDLFARGRLLRLLGESSALLRSGTRLGTIAAQTVGPFVPDALWRRIRSWRDRGSDLGDYSSINPNAGAAYRIAERAGERGLDLAYRPRRDGLETRLWALGRVDFGNYNKGVLGGWGIDYRDPTADRRLVEFCLSVPLEQYLTKGRTRALARNSLQDRLPASVTGQYRKGYQAADWHEGLAASRPDVTEEVERLSGVTMADQLLDTDMMAGLIQDWPEGDWNEDRIIRRYRLALLRGVSAGHFIRKASGSNS